MLEQHETMMEIFFRANSRRGVNVASFKKEEFKYCFGLLELKGLPPLDIEDKKLSQKSLDPIIMICLICHNAR